MADETFRKPAGGGSTGAPAGKPPTGTGANPLRDPRAGVTGPVRLRYSTFMEFIDTQSVNISRSGMFLATGDLHAVGTMLEFELGLTDGFALLRGRVQVVRLSQNPPGLGLRFLELDEASRKLIERIVDVNTREGKKPTVSLEFADGGGGDTASPAVGVEFSGRSLRIYLSPATAGYFLNNPLLNVRLGGFVVPAHEDVSLGTVFSVELVDTWGSSVFSGKGKVVAKHDRQLGIRLSDVDKATITQLQTEINKVAPNKTVG